MEKWLFPGSKKEATYYEEGTNEGLVLKIKIRNGCAAKDEYPQQDMVEECTLISSITLSIYRLVECARKGGCYVGGHRSLGSHSGIGNV